MAVRNFFTCDAVKDLLGARGSIFARQSDSAA
jgi:hypothetical protein